MTDLSTLETTAVVGAFITVLLVGRTYQMLIGTPYNPTRLFSFAGVYVALFVLLLAQEYSLLPWYSLPLDAVILVVGAVLSLPHIRRAVRIERRADGRWVYRLGPLVPAVYITLFLVRLVINAVVLNQSFASPPTAVALSPSAQATLAIVDVLFAFSTGLLVARSIAVYQAFNAGGPNDPEARST